MLHSFQGQITLGIQIILFVHNRNGLSPCFLRCCAIFQLRVQRGLRLDINDTDTLFPRHIFQPVTVQLLASSQIVFYSANTFCDIFCCIGLKQIFQFFSYSTYFFWGFTKTQIKECHCIIVCNFICWILVMKLFQLRNKSFLNWVGIFTDWL